VEAETLSKVPQSVGKSPHGWENWAGVMFAAGFFFALALGIYLAWSILRSGRD
jgi:hypothetical protein